MLKMTHHSGRSRWLNYELIEDVDTDDQGQTVITMASGRTHVALESAPEIIAALDEYYEMESEPNPPKLITMKESAKEKK